MSIFLTPEDIVILTGYVRHKAQIAALRKMAIPHFINAGGRPVVAAAAIDGIFRALPEAKVAWISDRSPTRK